MSRIGHETAKPFPGGKLLLVGNPGVIHIGAHFSEAAKSMGLRVLFCDSTEAFAARPWVVKFNWWLRGHRPSRIGEFSRKIVQVYRDLRPSWMVSTGIAPVEPWALEELGRQGVLRFNYLTDDPWNPAHRAPWFLKTLPLYDHVFSLRRSNLEDLRSAGCPRVSYLPFAYAPALHYRETLSTAQERFRFDSDVVFAGGADRDRVPYIGALIKAGFKVGLYGGYWERFPETRSHSRGHADPRTLRLAMAGARVALCLVRKANRDGNSMRTFEAPAMGTCMLTEDTEEHREIFGEDGEAVIYFRTIGEMLEKLKWLLANESERRRLACAAHSLIVNGRNTYKDRLMAMLGVNGSGMGAPAPGVEDQIGLRR